MTLATQTWRVAGPYVLRTDTLQNRMTDIKDAIAANGADSNGLWDVDAFTLTGTEFGITVKRKGSPSGTLGTYRAVLLGTTDGSSVTGWSSSPNLIQTTISNIAHDDCIIAGSAPAAGATGLTLTNIRTTAVLSQASTQYSKCVFFDGTIGSTSAGTGVVGALPTMYIIECDRMFAIVILSTTQMLWAVWGEIIEDLSNNTGIWAILSSAGPYNTATFCNNVVGAATLVQVPFPLLHDSPSNKAVGGYFDGASTYIISRAYSAITHAQSNSFLEGAGFGILMPVLISRRIESGGAGPFTVSLVGLLRQIRMGPNATNGIKRIFNSVPALRGYIAVPQSGTTTQGVVFDNSP